MQSMVCVGGGYPSSLNTVEKSTSAGPGGAGAGGAKSPKRAGGGGSSSGSSRRSAALSPLSDEALEALSPPKAAEEPDTARTDESGSKVDWEESEHVVDWVLGAA